MLTANEIRHGVAKVLIDSSDGWPPSLPEFISICRSAGVDVSDMFDRFMMREKPRNHFEFLVFDDADRANVRRKPMGDDERTFKRVLAKWMERKAKGTLPQEVPSLSAKSAVMPTDIMRERAGKPNPSQFRNGSVCARIAKLGQGS